MSHTRRVPVGVAALTCEQGGLGFGGRLGLGFGLGFGFGENVEDLKKHREEQRMGWAASCLKKAKKKLEEEDKAVADLERAVERLEGWLGALRRKRGLEENKEGVVVVVVKPEEKKEGGWSKSGTSDWRRGFLGHLERPPPPSSRAPTP